MFFKKKDKKDSGLRDDLQAAVDKIKTLGLGPVIKGLNAELTDTEKVVIVNVMSQDKGGGIGCLTTERMIYAQKSLQRVDTLSIPLERIVSVTAKNTFTGDRLTVSTAKTDYVFTNADHEFSKALQQATV